MLRVDVKFVTIDATVWACLKRETVEEEDESKCQRETVEEEGESKCKACDTNRVTQPYVGPVKSLEEARKQGFERAKQFQVHRHSPRCRKGKAGEHGCSQMLPQAILKDTWKNWK